MNATTKPGIAPLASYTPPTPQANTDSRAKPRQLTATGFAAAIPGFTQQFRSELPPDYWRQTDSQTVSLTCPCSETHTTKTGVVTGCECGRFFWFDGAAIRIARYPKTQT